MNPVPSTVTVRRAGPHEATALADLERDANLVALAHVFDPTEHAYPYAAVEGRWEALLADPAVVVEVVDGPGRLVGLLAHDAARVRHLAVHPDRWSSGLARQLLERAADRIRAGGRTPVLWCLAANHGARGLYEHLGWAPTGRWGTSEFAPHPEEVEYGWA